MSGPGVTVATSVLGVTSNAGAVSVLTDADGVTLTDADGNPLTVTNDAVHVPGVTVTGE